MGNGGPGSCSTIVILLHRGACNGLIVSHGSDPFLKRDVMKRAYSKFDFPKEYNLETIKETVNESYFRTLKEIE